jgi:hypothetical protein
MGLRGVLGSAARCCALHHGEEFSHVQEQAYAVAPRPHTPVKPRQSQERCSSSWGASEFEAGAGAAAAAPAERRHHRGDHDLHGLAVAHGAGFFAAVVRKKLALRLESEKTDGERVYRIVAGKTSADTAGDQPSA